MKNNRTSGNASGSGSGSGLGYAGYEAPASLWSRLTRFVPALPWVVSIIAHGGLIAGGFAIVWSQRASEEELPPTVVSFIEPSLQPVPLEQQQEPQLEQPEPAPSPELPEFEIPDIELPELPAFELEPVVPELPDEPTPEPVRAPAVDVNAPTFFGLRSGTARDIIYVVDGSASMISTFPLVLDELERSLRKLSPQQRVQVIFFIDNDRLAAPHPDDAQSGRAMARLIRATRPNIESVLTWARTVRVAGRSNPVPALEWALALEPEAIFLLSREITGVGEFEQSADEIMARLDALNPYDASRAQRRTVIKAVQFLDEDEIGLLKSIGERHGRTAADPDGGHVFRTREDLER